MLGYSTVHTVLAPGTPESSAYFHFWGSQGNSPRACRQPALLERPRYGFQ